MKISISGSGYVGLLSGTCSAAVGNTVFCPDVDDSEIARLTAGGIPIHAPGRAALVARNASAGRLLCSTSQDAADVLVMEWKAFRLPDFGRLATVLRRKTVSDGRNTDNTDDLETLAGASLAVESIGRSRQGVRL